MLQLLPHVSEEDLLCDTMVALQLLQRQFPHSDKYRGTPLMLRSQVYCLIKDRTAADRQLDGLRQRNVLRVFRVNCGPGDAALMPTADYVALTVGISEEHPPQSAQRAALRAFAARVLPACTGETVQRERLMELLEGAGCSGSGEEGLSALLQAGLVCREPGGDDALVFALPSIGPVIAAVNNGRKELVRALQRRKPPEMLEAELEKRFPLRSSCLNARFHIRHLLGSGVLQQRELPKGPSLLLARSAGA